MNHAQSSAFSTKFMRNYIWKVSGGFRIVHWPYRGRQHTVCQCFQKKMKRMKSRRKSILNVFISGSVLEFNRGHICGSS